ncbi:MAG: hypothetical protein ACI9FJ_002134 [Alteromonadaceae bacterium]|jgi:hypothetical protein
MSLVKGKSELVAAKKGFWDTLPLKCIESCVFGDLHQ